MAGRTAGTGHLQHPTGSALMILFIYLFILQSLLVFPHEALKRFYNGELFFASSQIYTARKTEFI